MILKSKTSGVIYEFTGRTTGVVLFVPPRSNRIVGEKATHLYPTDHPNWEPRADPRLSKKARLFSVLRDLDDKESTT